MTFCDDLPTLAYHRLEHRQIQLPQWHFVMTATLQNRTWQHTIEHNWGTFLGYHLREFSMKIHPQKKSLWIPTQHAIIYLSILLKYYQLLDHELHCRLHHGLVCQSELARKQIHVFWFFLMSFYDCIARICMRASSDWLFDEFTNCIADWPTDWLANRSLPANKYVLFDNFLINLMSFYWFWWVFIGFYWFGMIFIEMIYVFDKFLLVFNFLLIWEDFYWGNWNRLFEDYCLKIIVWRV